MSGDEQPDPRPKNRSHADMTLGEAIRWALSKDSTNATQAGVTTFVADAGVTTVRVVLTGGLTGIAAFDRVRLWEE